VDTGKLARSCARGRDARGCAEEARDLPSSLEEFVDRYQGQHRAV